MVKYICNINKLQVKTMIYAKNHKQGDLFDPWTHLGPKRRKLLDRSWAGLFREHILEELPVDELMPFFKEDFGRPTKELYTVMGAALLQQAHDLTGEETIEQVAFNEQWHYALNITDDSDEAAYIRPKTLYNVHRIFMDHDIGSAVFDKITDKLAEVFGVDTKKQRLDSVHIKSNMARLGRIRIMAKTIGKFLVNLRRHHRELFDELPEELAGKYMTKKALSCFSMVKPSESARTLIEVAEDLFDLAMHFLGNDCCRHDQFLDAAAGSQRAVQGDRKLRRRAGGGLAQAREGSPFGLTAKSLRPRRRLRRAQGPGLPGSGDGDLQRRGRPRQKKPGPST